MIKDKALNDVMKSKMGNLHQGFAIKIEVEPAEKDAENEDLKKQGLAPSLPAQDEEVKKVPGAEDEMMDDSQVADHFMSPEEQEEMQMMASQGQKPKGLRGKIEQGIATKKIAKFSKDGNA